MRAQGLIQYIRDGRQSGHHLLEAKALVQPADLCHRRIHPEGAPHVHLPGDQRPRKIKMVRPRFQHVIDIVRVVPGANPVVFGTQVPKVFRVVSQPPPEVIGLLIGAGEPTIQRVDVLDQSTERSGWAGGMKEQGEKGRR